MSIFNEFDLLRRSVGGIFDDFERSFFQPSFGNWAQQERLAAPEPQRQLNAARGGGKPGEEGKYQEEQKRDDKQVAERRLESGALLPFGGGWLRSVAQRPVDIRLDVNEDDKQITVNAEVPGVRKEDIKLDVEDGVLTLRAEKKEEKRQEDDKTKSLRVERSYGVAERSLVLPEYADLDNIQAKIDQGVLTITIPKKPQVAPKQRQVQIQ
jgi:HSP20 family protein